MAGNWGEAAIRAFSTVFSTVSDVLNKREMLARDEADRKIKEEERLANKPLLDETRKYNMDLLNQKRNEIFDSSVMPLIASAMEKTTKGIPLDESETGAVLMATNKADNWKDATPDQINDRNRSLRIVGDKIKAMEPTILEAMKTKQAVNISRQSDPDLFNAFDKLPAYGGSANKGLAADGQPAKSKTLDQATITPEGNMILKLRVEQQDGTVYYAPVTVGRDANPNAPILQIPVAMFGAKLQQELKFADTLDSVMKTLGAPKTAEEITKKRDAVKASESLLAGEIAVHEYLAANPEKKDDVNAIRSAYTMGARTKAKELGVTLSQTDLHNGAVLYIQGKGSKGEILYDAEGNAKSVDTQAEKDNAVLAGYKFTRPQTEKKGPADPAEIATFKQLYPDVPLSSPKGRELFRKFRKEGTEDKTKPAGPEKPTGDQALTAREKSLKARVDEWIGIAGYDEEGVDAELVQQAREKAAEALNTKGTTVEKALGLLKKDLPKKAVEEKSLWDMAKDLVGIGGKRELKRPDEGKKAPVVATVKAGEKAEYRDGTTAKGTGSDAGKEFKVVGGVWVEQKKR